MAAWSPHPIIYEVHTWAWLNDLGRARGRMPTLAEVREEEWDALLPEGVDAVWLMGVWERSPAGVAVALATPALLADFRRALPDFTAADVVGSPYCVRRYVVDERLGGPAGLAAARAALRRRGVGLVLDFVPNHVAPDHPWVVEHPEYFIRGDAADLAREPSAFFAAGEQVIARGRDPNFPPWPDVAQLNVFAPALRQASVATLREIAGQCDGVRCDMAMLLITRIFARTWGERAGPPPDDEFWPAVIGPVREVAPDFRFLAEAYWDTEAELHELGFDYCYDKRLYDRLARDTAATVRDHLRADLAYQSRLMRFVENHDEPRAPVAFPGGRDRVAAVATALLPGALLLHEGQLDGRRVRLPVFLSRRPDEAGDGAARAFYTRLLSGLGELRGGEWRLCEAAGVPGTLVAWCWRAAPQRCVVVVNLGNAPAMGRVVLPWGDLPGRAWELTDHFTGATLAGDGDDLAHDGLRVELPSRGFRVLRLRAV